MSATLRYDIGLAASEAILLIYAKSFDHFGGMAVTRWAGIRKGGFTNHTYTFAIKLPRQIAEAFHLTELAAELANNYELATLARKGCTTLANKLAKSIGLPWSETPPLRLHVMPVPDDERPFFQAIMDDPGDLSRWGVYADWLEERTGEDDFRRGATIRAWLDPKKAAKVTYGIPNVARNEPWRG